MKVTINGKSISYKAIAQRAKQSSFVGVNAANKFYTENPTDVVANASLAMSATVNTLRSSYNALSSTIKK
tara:strand:- start:2432 stop:2641 length:210 start_codon:yes stop_codon:yes gene_type:complete